MNRYRMRFAPHAWTPHLIPWMVRRLRPYRKRQQRRVVQIDDVEVRGADRIGDLLGQGNGALIMPNHSSHADPYVIYAAADAIDTACYVMATWHVFHDKSFLAKKMLRWHGCFSVDREANDIGAFRLASGILREKREPLVIFPEGEIYHCNDRVTPFRDGAAAIAIAAARKAERKIFSVPCAIKYYYVDDPTDALQETMGQLEEAIFWRRRGGLPLQQRIYHFAEALLAVKELEYFREARQGVLPDRIRAIGQHLLSEVERRHELKGTSPSIPERVKAARRRIIEERSAESIDEATKTQLDDDLEDLFLVVQSFSYPGDYVVAKPSIERMAETLDKFEEDVLNHATAQIKARRRAIVQFGEPIEVESGKKGKGQAAALSQQVEDQVQSMLDEINESESEGV